jgi:hypothetical protein
MDEWCNVGAFGIVEKDKRTPTPDTWSVEVNSIIKSFGD